MGSLFKCEIIAILVEVHISGSKETWLLPLKLVKVIETRAFPKKR